MDRKPDWNVFLNMARTRPRGASESMEAAAASVAGGEATAQLTTRYDTSRMCHKRGCRCCVWLRETTADGRGCLVARQCACGLGGVIE